MYVDLKNGFFTSTRSRIVSPPVWSSHNTGPVRAAGIVTRGTRSSRTDDRIIFVCKGALKAAIRKLGYLIKKDFYILPPKLLSPSSDLPYWAFSYGWSQLFERVASATSRSQAYKLILSSFAFTKSLDQTFSSVLSLQQPQTLQFNPHLHSDTSNNMATKTHKTWQEELVGKTFRLSCTPAD